MVQRGLTKFCLVSLVLVVSAQAALAQSAAPPLPQSRALQSACFPPEALAAIPDENVPVKHDRRFDQPEKNQTLVPAEPVKPELRGSIRRVDLPKGRKLIALTFDLCEDRGEVAGYEGRIFETLRRENVKATLFAGGKWMRSHMARTQQLMSDPLFEIANHAEAHRNLRLLQEPNLSAEIAGPQRSYENIRQSFAATQCAAPLAEAMQSVAPRLSLFRFPFGACNPASLAAVNDAGLLAIQWDISSGDPDPHMDANAIVAQVLRHAKPGSIVVSHANGRGWHTAEALPLLIAKLKAQGYEFATVSELIAAGKPVIADTCYDSKPGDTDRYDLPFSVRNKPRTGEELPWAGTITAPPERHSDRRSTPSGEGGSSFWLPF
jgi:peptidoglycan/xylan/chitin deacetylase (PgdA/CDA1 family)